MAPKRRNVRPFNLNMDRGMRDHLKLLLAHSRVSHTTASAIREMCRRFVIQLRMQLEAEAQNKRLYIVSCTKDGLEEKLGELDCRL